MITTATNPRCAAFFTVAKLTLPPKPADHGYSFQTCSFSPYNTSSLLIP
jgi:hypothetical protein